jgi:hypothetical protein
MPICLFICFRLLLLCPQTDLASELLLNSTVRDAGRSTVPNGFGVQAELFNCEGRRHEILLRLGRLPGL